MAIVWETLSREGPDAAGVARLILNRPSRMNAINKKLFHELPLAAHELDDNPAVRVIIVAGAGEHFCSGIDLQTLSSPANDESADPETGRREFGREREGFLRGVKKMQNAFTAFETCRKPVIAEVHGACIGAGVDLITACDLRYCTEDATFSVKEVDIAITSDLGTLQRLPFVVGYSKAMELALTARSFDGKEAYRLGLVHGIFPSKESLEEGVRELATNIAEKAPLAIMGTKQVLLKGRDASIAEGLDYVAAWNAAHLWAGDVLEIMAAKKEKRKPLFARL